MSDNIRHQRSIVTGRLNAINNKINQFQTDTENEYNAINTGISKSSCDHEEAIKQQIEKEKKAASEVTAFFLKLTAMMEKASEAIDKVENDYSAKKVD